MTIVPTNVVVTGVVMTISEELQVKDFPSPYLKAVLNILFTGHWLTGRINNALKPLGTSEPQYNVLTILFVQRGVPISASEMQDRMIQRESNVTRIVDKLVDRGWATRELCEKNRRKVDIIITEEGRKVFKKGSELVMKFHEPLMNKLAADDMEFISEKLDLLRNTT
jgi:MarR family 2-MHQ and catechol resistance regulon transcriptional repressor